MKRQVCGKTKEKASPRMFIIRKTTIDGLVDVGLSHKRKQNQWENNYRKHESSRKFTIGVLVQGCGMSSSVTCHKTHIGKRD